MLPAGPATLQAQQQLETLDREVARLQHELHTGFAAADAIVRSVRKLFDLASAPSCGLMRQ